MKRLTATMFLLLTVVMAGPISTAHAKVYVEGWRVTIQRTGAISVRPCHHKPCGRVFFDFAWHGEIVGHGSVPCPRAPSLHIVSADNRNATVYGCRVHRTFAISIPYSD